MCENKSALLTVLTVTLSFHSCKFKKKKSQLCLEADWSLMGWKATEYTTKFLQVCFTFTSKKKKKSKCLH